MALYFDMCEQCGLFGAFSKPLCPACGGNIITTDLDITTDETEEIKEEVRSRFAKTYPIPQNYVNVRNVYEKAMEDAIYNKGKAPVDRYNESNIPKCPHCKSTRIQKISGTKRFMSVGLFGLASSNIGKTMECRQCGYKW